MLASMDWSPVSLPAPAKINLHLRVGRTLPDGRHELDTSFIFTEASDELHFEPARSLQVICSRPELSGEHNLVHRILSAFSGIAPQPGGMRIRIDKRLPVQAGLGGGSSDAATALILANHVWGVNWSSEQLIEFAAPFGADIPCFLYGRASRAGGVGERLQPLKLSIPDGWLLMAWPGSGLSTAEVFRRFDAGTLTAPEGLDTMRRDPIRIGENELEAAACELNPAMRKLLDAMRCLSPRAWMSGSGSTCVALFASRQKAREAEESLRGSGLASWTHCGRLMPMHPLAGGAWAEACRISASGRAGNGIGT